MQKVMSREAELHKYLPGVGRGGTWCLLSRACSCVCHCWLECWSKAKLLYSLYILFWHFSFTHPNHGSMLSFIFPNFLNFQSTLMQNIMWSLIPINVIPLLVSKYCQAFPKASSEILKKAQEDRTGCLFSVLWQYCLSSLSTCGEQSWSHYS